MSIPERSWLTLCLGLSLTAGNAALAQVTPTDTTQPLVAQTVNPTPLQIPRIFDNPIVPTDVTGVGGSLGHAQGLRERILGPDRNVIPESRGMIAARDPRFCFNGRWITPTVETLAMAPGYSILTSAAVLPRTAALSAGRRADAATTAEALLMPAAGASYMVPAPDRLHLHDGAIMVKGGLRPFFVLAPLNGGLAVIRIEADNLALISNFCGRLNVTNLDDRHADSLITYFSGPGGEALGETAVRVGHMLEIYPGATGGEQTIAAYRYLSRLQLANGYTVDTLQLHYPRALKRFNITRALAPTQLNSLLKTAAAVAYTDRQREINGLIP